MSPYLPLLLGVLIWSGTAVVLKSALAGVNPFTLLSLRASTAFLFLFIFARRDGFRLSMLARREMLYLGLSGVGFAYLFQTLGLRLTSAGNASLIVSAIPVTTCLFSYFLLKEKLAPLKIIGVLVSITGVVIVTLGGNAAFNGSSIQGDLLMLSSTVLWGLYNVLVIRYSDRFSSLVITAGTFGVGFIFSLPFAIWESFQSGLTLPAPIDWLKVLYLGVGSAGLCYLIFNRAFKVLDTALVSSFTNLIPVVGLFFAYLWGETVGIFQVLGGALAVLGVFVVQRAAFKPGAAPQEVMEQS